MRNIGYIGDSTDEETDEGDISLTKQRVSKSTTQDLVQKLNLYHNYHYKYKQSHKVGFNYGNAVILKEIGQQILKSPEVRKHYSTMKEQYFVCPLSQDLKMQVQALDKIIGPSYSMIATDYKPSEGTLQNTASDFFVNNQRIINKAFSHDTVYNSFVKNSEKANYYVQQHVKDQVNTIYSHNRQIELLTGDQRSNLEPSFETAGNTRDDASIFLAQRCIIKKFNKLSGVNALCDYKFGTHKHINQTLITNNTTQKNATLAISKLGAFSDYVTDEGAYDSIQNRLQRYIKDRYIDKSKLSEFFKRSIRGEKYEEVILDDNLKVNLMYQLQSLVKLLFGVEVQRNASALLTHAMFFDLVDTDIYKINDMVNMIPMAMESAVSASTTIDKLIRTEMQRTHTSEYDCRIKLEANKAGILAGRDEKILHDWVKYKLQETLDEKVINIHSDPTIQKLTNCFQNLNINVVGLGRTHLKENEHMVLDSKDNKFSGGKIQWNNNKSHIKCTLDKVNKIEAKVFYNLIKDWYGIELSCLNKDDSILLKAAAEPKDPTLDRDDYQSSFKIPASDTASEGAASKMKLLDYKQKYVLNHSKLKALVDKMDSNKITTNKVNRVDKAINQSLHLTAEELISTLGKLFGPTDLNKSSDEIMSCLKAIRLGLKSSEKIISTNKLNLKDPNQHFMEGNVLSIDDLFNGVLDRVNEAAIENNRQDILATLQEEHSYDLQEQVNIVGNTGI